MSVSRDDRFEVSVRDAPSWHSTFLQKARISPREWFVVVRFPHELVCLVFENPSNSVAFSEVATLVRRGTVQASFGQCRWCGARGLKRIGSGLESLSNLTHVRYFRCVCRRIELKIAKRARKFAFSSLVVVIVLLSVFDPCITSVVVPGTGPL